MEKPALTPALSHPMGEGESFAVACKVESWSLHHALVNHLRLPIAVPSPVGRERVRVRVYSYHR